MGTDKLFELAIGPYGALLLSIVAVIYLARKLDQSQAVNARQSDLFEEALKIIRDDLVPMVRALASRR